NRLPGRREGQAEEQPVARVEHAVRAAVGRITVADRDEVVAVTGNDRVDLGAVIEDRRMVELRRERAEDLISLFRVFAGVRIDLIVAGTAGDGVCAGAARGEVRRKRLIGADAE